MKKRDNEGQKTSTVRVRLDILNKARTVAIWRGMEISEYVDCILRPVVEKEFGEWVHAAAKKS